MKRQKRGLGSVLFGAAVVLVGLVVFGSLFKLLLAAGAAFVVWKLFFDREPSVPAPVLPARTQLLAPPLDLAPPEKDPELARLDRELERAIQAAKSASATS